MNKTTARVVRHDPQGSEMGLFGGMKNTYKKSEAAVVVQNLLEHQANAGILDADPAKLATNLVEHVWEQKPDIFNGKFGQRPHKISVAAASLANALGMMREDNRSRSAVMLSLGNILLEVETNGMLYPFNNIDEQLLGTAANVFAEATESSSSLSNDIDHLMSSEGPTIVSSEENLVRKKEAAAFIDAQVAEGAMTAVQFDAICGMLTTSSMMTGNIQEAYEMIQGKPVPEKEFMSWLNDDPEGRRWKAVWVLIRKGQPDTVYCAI